MKGILLNLNEVFLVLTAAEALLLFFFFRFMPSQQQQPRGILALFFLNVTVTLVSILFTWNAQLRSMSIAHVSLVPIALSISLLMQGPLLYLYLRSLQAPQNLLHWKQLIHIAPALVATLVILIFKIDVVDWVPVTWPSLTEYENKAVRFVWALSRCYPLVYVIACAYAEYRLRQQLRQNYSAISTKELLWADIVLVGFLVTWLWSFAGYFLGAYLSDGMNDLIGILNDYLNTIFVNAVCIFGFINTRDLFKSPVILEEEKPIETLPETDERIAAIERGIHERKLYLESQINLDRFSEQIGVKSREVSMILNSHYDSNFFEFINRYRVEEAKRLLLAPEHSQDTILDIIYKSGFNSQSAFHRFFKRLVGVTPSEFRIQHQQASKSA